MLAVLSLPVASQDLWQLGARVSGLPVSAIYGIALAESGRTVNGVRKPHPWTINVNSSPPRARYFDTQPEAEKYLEELLRSGWTNVDVGIMQVNVKYHGHSIKDPKTLLDPKVNILVSAVFLSELLKETGNIGDAISKYHSRTPSKGDQYKKRVFDNIVGVSK